MKVSEKKCRQLLSIGDTIFHIVGRKVHEGKVIKIFADSIMTDQDVCFYDEHGKNWMFTRSEAEKMALKSQKSVL